MLPPPTTTIAREPLSVFSVSSEPFPWYRSLGNVNLAIMLYILPFSIRPNKWSLFPSTIIIAQLAPKVKYKKWISVYIYRYNITYFRQKPADKRNIAAVLAAYTGKKRKRRLIWIKSERTLQDKSAAAEEKRAIFQHLPQIKINKAADTTTRRRKGLRNKQIWVKGESRNVQ